MDAGITAVADLGHIVFTYAFYPTIWEGGTYIDYATVSGVVLADEGRGKSFRKQHAAAYKAQRDYTTDTQIQARQFWNEIRDNAESRGHHIISIPGYEADDVVALLAMHYGLGIIGVDKDFFQIEGTSVRSASGVERYISPERLAKGYSQVSWSPQLWLLHLAIDGDAADNVPRIRDKGRRGIAEEASILLSPRPFTEAYNLYGDVFLENLWQVILPHPMCVDPDLRPYDVYWLCDEGKWREFVVSKTAPIPLPMCVLG